MTQKSKKHEKSVLMESSIRDSEIGAPDKEDGVPISNEHNVGIPSVHILSKKDIEKELSQIKTKFGMTSDQFHEAWKKGRIHGHEAVKLGSYFEFYKVEYE